MSRGLEQVSAQAGANSPRAFRCPRRIVQRAAATGVLAVTTLLAGAIGPVAAQTRNGDWSRWVGPVMPSSPEYPGGSAIYDPQRDRILMFGGAYLRFPPVNRLVEIVGSGTQPQDVLDVNGPSPPARIYHSAIYDPLRDRMIVFGGHADALGNVPLNDVWELTLADPMTWTQVFPQGVWPSPRYWHTAVYDASQDRMVVFGGIDSSGARNDVWALSLADPMTWTELAPLGTPPAARYGHAAAVDPVTNRMYVFGGRDSATVFDDVWLYWFGPEVWLAVSPTVSGNPSQVSPPGGRYGFAMAYDPVNYGFLIHGGTDSFMPRSGVFDDTYELLLGATPPVWVERRSQYPGRYATTGIFDTARNEFIVSSGYLSQSSLNNGYFPWGLSPFAYGVASDQWRAMYQSSNFYPPQPNLPLAWRQDPAVVLDVPRNRLVIFGGTASDTVWSFSLEDTTFSEITHVPGPGPVDYPAAIYDPLRERMVMFGGYSDPGVLSDQAWAFDLAGTGGWSQLAASASPRPAARAHASAVYDWRRDRVIVFGGLVGAGGTVSDDTWALDLSVPGGGWTELATSGPRPEPRDRHNAVYDARRDRMIVLFGAGTGENGIDDEYTQSMWALDCASDTWSLVDPLLPFRRRSAGAIIDPVGDRLVIFGGRTDEPGWLFVTDTLFVWPLDGGPWEKLVPGMQPAPSPGWEIAAFYDAMHDRMVIHRGSGLFRIPEIWSVEWGSTNATAAGDVPPPSAVRAPYPNPFNPETTIPFTLRRPGVVRVSVFDAAGRRVADVTRRRFGAGEHRVRWNGRDRTGRAVASGVYFVRVEGPGVRAARKVVLVK